MKRKTDIKLVIFDLDGTLINTDLYVVLNHVNLCNHFYKCCKFDLNTLLSFSGPSLNETYEKYYNDINKDEYLKVFGEFSDKYSNYYSKLYNDELKVLSDLKNSGYKLAIFTSKRRHATMINLKHFDLEKYFDDILCVEDVKSAKPSGEGILKLLEKYNLSKNEALMIGDSDADYFASVDANIGCYLACWGLKKFQSNIKPLKFVTSYNDIAEELINYE